MKLVRYIPLAAASVEHVRSETDRLEDLQALIEGQVFHVTKRIYWPSIVATGEHKAAERLSSVVKGKDIFRLTNG